MKYLIVFLSIIFCSVAGYAQQGIVTETYKVQGCCGSCKKRIEEAAFVKGVKRTTWDKETQKLTVVYNNSKTSADKILGAVAKAGHSNERVEATEADYDKLPECCHYKTTTCNH